MRSVYLKNVTFHVRASGRKRVLDTGRKNVHAWMEGDLVELNPLEEHGVQPGPGMGWLTHVSYNPYRFTTFVASNPAEHAHLPIFKAEWAHAIPEGTVRAPRSFNPRKGIAFDYTTDWWKQQEDK